jgi:heme/copper-type cytochrome/quinol oxidase subunit 3
MIASDQSKEASRTVVRLAPGQDKAPPGTSFLKVMWTFFASLFFLFSFLFCSFFFFSYYRNETAGERNKEARGE